MADQMRLNYTIPEDLEDALTSYYEITGRSASDVVRQLIFEVIEDDRPLPTPEDLAEKPESRRKDRRTDMWIERRALDAFDARIVEIKLGARAAVIAGLLTTFLRSRANHAGEEIVRAVINIDRESYARLGNIARSQGRTPEQLISEIAQDHARKSSSRGNKN